MGKRVLLTGASGFVGSHVLRHLLINTDWECIVPVTFRHRGNSDRIASAIESHPRWRRRVDVVICDLTAPVPVTTRHRFGHIDYVLNVASESHVDRSIDAPASFIRNNVDLMINVLEYARQAKPDAVLQMSTDEVYGPALTGQKHREWDSIKPSNPYSASKAAQEAVAFSYWRTYGVPVVITNTMNIIGEMQNPEKLVPKTIRSLRAGEPVTVHVSADGTSGSRFYLHARNLADAWLWLLRTQRPQLYGEHEEPSRWNIVGEREITNVQMVQMIADVMHIPEPKLNLVDFHTSRPGHDLRYALDGSKIVAAGWKMPVPIEQSLRRTIEWTLSHPEWLDPSE